MTLVVGYKSALEYWRCVGPRYLGTTRRRRSAAQKANRTLLSGESPILTEGNLRPAGCQLPLHVVVGSPSQRVRSKKLVSHVSTSKMLASSYVNAGDDFVVASPELCFLQLASSLSLEHLIQVGYELCGTYALQANSSAIFREKPLTSVSRIAAFVHDSERVQGRKKALRALKYIQDNSASPRETILAMLLTLPYALGGYGITQPNLNYRVEIPQTAKNKVDRAFYVLDICWPKAKFCLEYDSAQYHLNPAQQEADARKRNALEALGYTVFTVSPGQISDSGSFNRVAKQVAHHLGKRLRYKDPEFTRRHLVLREVLMQERCSE